jgi:hypothetical protein
MPRRLRTAARPSHAELKALVDEHTTAESGVGTRIEAAYLRVAVMV